MEFERVEIVWFDAQSSMEPMDIEEAINKLEPVLTKSIGYLIHETKEYVLLGFMHFGEGLIKHWQIIPRKMIKEIRELKR